ncbi:MAG: hypothetical protein ABIJ97_11470 [Bacteroidota bacterium]
MYCLHKIYEGKLKNKGSESFRFTVKDFKKIRGAFCSGGTGLSLVFDNGRTVMLRNFEQRESTDIPPNKRPLIFEEKLNNEIITGVIMAMDNPSPTKNHSVYLILEN